MFQNKLVDCITKYNDIDLSLPGQRPCAYYCIISDQDTSLEFLSSMFFSLLFSRLTDYARRHGTNGRLPVKVNVCLEEFCNIGYLGESFLRVLSVIRSRNVACQLVIQGAAQLSGRYPHKEWEEIIGNCDWQIFLGCNDHMTADYISEKCGMVTIRTDSNQREGEEVECRTISEAQREPEGHAAVFYIHEKGQVPLLKVSRPHIFAINDGRGGIDFVDAKL